MCDTLPVQELSEGQRTRVITDLLNWYDEVEPTGKIDVQERIEWLDTHSDTELLKLWYKNVGEWVMTVPQRHAHIPSTVDNDIYCDYQIGLLIDGQETDYGFINPFRTSHVEERLSDTSFPG